MWLAPTCAVLLGVAGGFLRVRQLENAFEEATGLAKTGAPESAAVLALSIVVAVTALGLAVWVSRRFKAQGSYCQAFRLPGTAALIAFWIFSAMTLTGSVMFALGKRSLPVTGLGEWMFVAFAVATGVSMLVDALTAITKREGQLMLAASVVPAVFYCYWLVLLYRTNLSNPVLSDFCYGCLGFACAAMSFYYVAGFVFGRRKNGCTAFFLLTAIFFLCIELVDESSSAMRLMLIGTIGVFFILCGSFLQRLSPKDKAEETGSGQNTDESAA